MPYQPPSRPARSPDGSGCCSARWPTGGATLQEAADDLWESTLGTDTLVDVGATCSSGPATAMRGVPLGMAEGTQVTDEVPRSAWRAVATMADAGIAHGALDADHILVLPDGAIRLVDLRAAVAGAPVRYSRPIAPSCS